MGSLYRMHAVFHVSIYNKLMAGLPAIRVRTLSIFWAGLAIVAIVLIATVATVSTSRLAAMNDRIFLDGEARVTAGAFERAVLAQRRNVLLWQRTGNEQYLREASDDLAELDTLLPRLGGTITTVEEREIAEKVQRLYGSFRLVAANLSGDPALVTARTEALLAALEQYRTINTMQMQATRVESAELNAAVDRGVLLAIGAVSLLFFLGALSIWTRVFVPLGALSATFRRVGEGDLAARCPVRRADEMGQMARTFNGMVQALADRERERLDLLAAVAHDIRNPLTAIGGMAYLLESREALSEKGKSYLTRIKRRVRDLEAMTGAFIDAAQSETGRLDLQTAPVDLPDLLRGIIEDAIIDHPDFRFEIEGTDSLVTIGDAPRLKRVFANIIGNAVKYCPAGTLIRVLFEKSESSVTVRVVDEGPGMTEEDLKRVGLPFQRGRGSASHIAGTGLGLYSSRRIIEAHGGLLEIQSTRGKGTAVAVSIPLLNM